MERYEFTDRAGNTGYAEGEPGTNFGLRISAGEATRLLVTYGLRLPFDIMAAGYGDDPNWVGLYPDDLDDDEQLIDPEGWAPFELTAGPTRPATKEELAKAEECGYFVPDATLTPDGALDRLQAFLSAASRDYEQGERPDIDEAFWVLGRAVEAQEGATTR